MNILYGLNKIKSNDVDTIRKDKLEYLYDELSNNDKFHGFDRNNPDNKDCVYLWDMDSSILIHINDVSINVDYFVEDQDGNGYYYISKNTINADLPSNIKNAFFQDKDDEYPFVDDIYDKIVQYSEQFVVNLKQDVI